ncbi:MAG TPA: NAD(P)/FAD-dependent oxidoreductase [Syntrophales bacterium]|nr:NAD(P)/FAD-dependent oxidoreductase [Syntrophales bacterium]HOM06289.1 NAD(P)/FAD-dependent oxidoreductase [Syntrophales bacterium]HPQ05730.1 NAD(P)/FAD-dependent oxidoreductase [Syntrophales bacterium]HRS86733.1 NAD(P)/FAD-dependent oxidoreductase [Syntrophales bacterium]
MTVVRRRIVVVGGGASGLLAAARAAQRGGGVVLLEKMPSCGLKILVSGKSRCNLTNIRDLEAFLPMYGPQGVFLRQAFHRFFREDLLALLGRFGVATKVERGGRVFPVSDDAGDVLAALLRFASTSGVIIRTGVRVEGIRRRGDEVAGVETAEGFVAADRVIIATGGASWPGTGSSGDGYAMAAALGHRIVALRPALVPLVVEEQQLAAAMQGLSLKNVRLTSFRGRKGDFDPLLTPGRDYGRGFPGRPPAPVIESRFGEMLFTHFGIGGPVTLLMSLAVADALRDGPVGVSIDLKPALDPSTLDERLRRDLDRYGRRLFRTVLAGLVPAAMVSPLAALCDVPLAKRSSEITRGERERVVHTLKSLRFTVKATLPLERAMVTAGGVSLDEVDPRTMASRLVRGLHLCGEVLDLDADTGGYNLQAAFSTGWVAGEAAAGGGG